jgi:hypothetical protein
VEDASGSTQYAIADYQNWLTKNVTSVASGGGSVAVVVATGQPLSQSDLMSAAFNGETGEEDTAQRQADVGSFLDQVQSAVSSAQTGSSDPTPGSGIVEGLDLFSGRHCTAIAALSDGYENESVNVYTQDILSGSGRAALVARLTHDHLTPDFQDVPLELPYGGFEPQGSSLSPARVEALPMFWAAYAKRTHTHLEWRNG